MVFSRNAICIVDINLYIDSLGLGWGVLQEYFTNYACNQSPWLPTGDFSEHAKSLISYIFHAYWYMNVMRSSRLFMWGLCFLLHCYLLLMIQGCFIMVSNVIRSNYCFSGHTMFGNMVFAICYLLGVHIKAAIYLCAWVKQCTTIKWSGNIIVVHLIGDFLYNHSLKWNPLDYRKYLQHIFSSMAVMMWGCCKIASCMIDSIT